MSKNIGFVIAFVVFSISSANVNGDSLANLKSCESVADANIANSSECLSDFMKAKCDDAYKFAQKICSGSNEDMDNPKRMTNCAVGLMLSYYGDYGISLDYTEYFHVETKIRNSGETESLDNYIGECRTYQ